MRNLRPLDALLPKTRQGILAATLVQPDKAWYASELAWRMGVPSSSLQRELRELTDAGILKTHRQGRMAYYQANTASPVYSDLRGLLLKTAGLIDVLDRVLEPIAKGLQYVFVYGSVAAGTEQSDSDIDLLVVGSASPSELAMPLRHASELLGRHVNPSIYTQVEFEVKRAANDHFLSNILAGPRLNVIGDGDELDQTT
jgi:DNA-binding transcriptional ArsR family regulator